MIGSQTDEQPLDLFDIQSPAAGLPEGRLQAHHNGVYFVLLVNQNFLRSGGHQIGLGFLHALVKSSGSNV